MKNANAVRAELEKVLSDLASHPDRMAKNPKKDFTRNRKLPLLDVLRFPILMERDNVDMELLKYFSHDKEATPSQSAFIQQRAKLVPNAFKLVLEEFNKALPPTPYLGKYVLYGVDGSGFAIDYNPKDPDTFSPPSGNAKKGNNEIHVIAAYRLTDHLFTDAVIQPYRKKNEYSAICDIIDRCPEDGVKPIFIADRGFPSFNMYAHASEKGCFFLARLKEKSARALLGDGFPESGEFDITVERIVTRSQSKKSRSMPDRPDLYRFVPPAVQFDYLPPGSPGEYHIRLRLLRVEISEGNFEYLVTNLPPDEFDKDALRALYRARWGEETSFRYLKHAIGAVDFHSRSFENVCHEVWARFVLYNVCSAITTLATARQPKDSSFIFQVNYTMAFKNTHTFLLWKEKDRPMDIVGIIERYICPVRPGRCYERRRRYQVPLKFSYRH